MNIFAISGLINAVCVFILGSVVYLKNRTKEINIQYSLFCLFVAIWSFCYFLWQASQEKNIALFWARSLMAGAIFIPLPFLHFVLLLLERYEKQKRIVKIGYVVFSLFFLSNFTPWFVNDVRPKMLFKFWPDPGPLFTVFLLILFWYCMYPCYLLIKDYKKFSGIKRQQIKYVLIGILIGYSSGSTNYFLWYDIPIPPFGNFIVPLFVSMMAYAVIRHRLMDINIAFTRTGVFIAVYLLVLGIPFWIGFKYLGRGAWIIPVSVMAVFATAGPFIYIFLQRLAEEALLKEQRRYQETIDNLAENMIEIRDMEKLPPTISSTVAEAIKIKFALIYLKQEEYNSFQLKSCYPNEAKSQFPELIALDDPLIGILNQHRKPLLSEEIGQHDKLKLDSGVVIPLFGKSGFIGFIVLGGKKNNEMYTNDDLRVLKSLSLDTASTIENCIFWKVIEDRHRRARLQEMDSFAYSFAHEIHNPLTFVRNLARVLKERFSKYITDLQDRKEFVEMCDVIFEGADRVMTIVEAIRKFGAKTTGEFEILKLQEVINGFFTLFGPELKTNFVMYTKEIPEEPIFVKGVAAELQQVLMIFGRNSIYAMRNCQEKKLSLKVTKLNHSTVRVAVSDNGEGIKKEIMDLIFRALFTTKASSEGTGMGLSNAKNFITRHNGRISAESEGEGKGATLIFELPIVQEAKPDDDSKKKGKTDWAF